MVDSLIRILDMIESEDVVGKCIVAAVAARVITLDEANVIAKNQGIDWISWQR